ncbi:MAG TPA: anthranilate synthase component I [Pseudogracilibacillus sp.]|nr:anthranilate synthase component I [Pseudogracilibacillus sp.]
MIGQQSTYKLIKKNADMLTPVGIFKRLQGEKKFLLESSFQHETKGKYSYIGANPCKEIIGYEQETTVTDLYQHKTDSFSMNCLDYIKEHLPKLELDIPLPFTGGAIGYASYDAVRSHHTIGDALPDTIGTPDYHFMVYDTIIVYEHRTETAYIIAVPLKGESTETLEKRVQHISNELDETIQTESPETYPIHFEQALEKNDFMNQVKQAKEYIHQGEATQIVLSQQMTADVTGDPFAFYRHLRSKNPSPYMFYIDFTEYLIIGASPESLVQTTKDQVVTNPIAGTRPRAKKPSEDQQLAAELLQDPKEIAEHNMLVDLSKEDFQNLCQADSIHVPVYQDVTRYEHVMHLVSEVHGTLKPNQSSMDALIACLPAGTVSGSPKTRAMQIINEIETAKRGFYAGGIGYISFNHDINFAIAIRSLVVKNQKAYLQVGAGIVEDSVPEKEYEETLHKAKSLTNLHT